MISSIHYTILSGNMHEGIDADTYAERLSEALVDEYPGAAVYVTTEYASGARPTPRAYETESGETYPASHEVIWHVEELAREVYERLFG